MHHHTTLTQFFIGLLVIAFIALAAGIWAYGAWLEHYA